MVLWIILMITEHGLIAYNYADLIPPLIMSSGILEPNFIRPSVIWDVRVYIFFPSAFLGWTFTGCFQKAQRVNILLKSKQNHSDLAKRAVLLTNHSVSTQDDNQTFTDIRTPKQEFYNLNSFKSKSLNFTRVHYFKKALANWGSDPKLSHYLGRIVIWTWLDNRITQKYKQNWKYATSNNTREHEGCRCMGI